MARIIGNTSRQDPDKNEDNPYLTGISGGAQPPGAATGGGDKRKTGVIGDFNVEKTYGRRTDPKWSNPAYLQYLPLQRPDYLKYHYDDVKGPAIAGRGNPGLIAALQEDMVAAGLITSNVPRGVWDPKTESAYERLLELANMWNTTDKGALNMLMSGGPTGGGGKVGGVGYEVGPNGEIIQAREEFVPPPLQYRLPNDLDIEKAVRQTSIDLLGQGWEESRIQAFIKSYKQELMALQKDAYTQEIDRMRKEFHGQAGASEPITEVAAPSMEAAADEAIRQQDPEGVEEYSGLNLLMDVIDQWGG